MVMFAASLASRGLGNKKTDKETKQLRVLSCFGGINEIPPCPHLKQSSVDITKHYCGGCGCGDKKHTWLIANETEYSKLDYPVLNCPLAMPGFSNYDPNVNLNYSENRKTKIQDTDPDQLKLIQVTVGQSEEKENLIDSVNKIINDS
jgi:hypothetical protein